MQIPDDTVDLRSGPEINPLILSMLPLVGEWHGDGLQVDPDSGETREVGLQIGIAHDGRPFVSYEQRMWLIRYRGGDAPHPFQRERGFWRRGFGQDAIEVTLADPEGGVHTLTGVAGDARYELASEQRLATPTGRVPLRETRMYAVLRDRLLIVTERQSDDGGWEPLLNASLRRVS
jgi:hypothetical protein